MPTQTPLPPTPRKHHKHSPSSLNAKQACCHFQPHGGDSPASLRGTRLHTAVETRNLALCETDEEARAVELCIGFEDSIIAAYGEGALGSKPVVFKEQYMSVDAEDTSGGYMDLAVLSADKKKLAVVDWKFVQNPVVESEYNIQGQAYALGTLRKCPHTVQTVDIYYVMPFLDTIDIHTFGRESFPEMLVRIKRIVSDAETLARPPQCVPAACQYCAKLGQCVAVAKLAETVARKFSPAQVPAEVTPELLNDPKVAKAGMAVANLVEAWAKAWRARCSSKALEDPGWVPEGMTLVMQTPREVINPLGVIQLLKERNLPEAVIFDKCVDVGITRVEKLISDSNPRGRKTQAVEEFATELLARKFVKAGNPRTVLRAKSESVEDI
jgi:hypothetical protein